MHQGSCVWILDGRGPSSGDQSQTPPRAGSPARLLPAAPSSCAPVPPSHRTALPRGLPVRPVASIVAVSSPRRPVDQEAGVLLALHGAHGASSRTGRVVALAIASSLVAILGAAPTVGATTSTTSTQTSTGTVALTTTTIDKPWYSVEQFDLAL